MHCDEFIRRTYRGAIEWPLAYFQHATLDAMAKLISFDSAMWGRGGEPPESIVDVYLDRQPKRMIEQYMADFQHEDFLADAVRSQPGKTINLVDLMSREMFEKTRIYREYARHWGVEQILSTCWVEPLSGLVGFMSLWRTSQSQVFTETERAALERLIPHIAEAHRICRIAYMRHPKANMSTQPHAIALCNPRGALIEVEPSFYELIHQEWPDWQGMTLPKGLLPAITRQSVFRGHAVIATASPIGDMVRIEIRRSCGLDSLGKRQLDIALRYARGESHRDISCALSLAESTVRNHIACIFSKCQVHNKIELATLIQKYEISSKQ